MKIFSSFFILLIKCYKYFVSPYFSSNCKFLPTCSEYCIDCIKINGLGKGLMLGLKRILKCHPIKFLGGSNGFDPAPNLKREKK